MPIATFDQYCAMLDNAKRGRFAYPGINVSGLETLNAVLEGFAEARSDGIVQVSSGGGAHATGPAVGDMALGAQVIAEAARRLAERHGVLIALHTDHCHPKNLKPFMDPLIEVSEGGGDGIAVGDRGAAFKLVSGVMIEGGFAGSKNLIDPDACNPDIYPTILSGDLNSNDHSLTDPCEILKDPSRMDNSYNVVAGHLTDPCAVLDGFIITGGVADGLSGSGGGLFIVGGQATIRRCTFRENAATWAGGAVYCGYSEPSFYDCTFEENYAWSGGAIYCSYSSPTIAQCSILGNTAGGDGEEGGVGGGVCCVENSAPVLIGNLIEGNCGQIGGGISCLESDPDILFNTIKGNCATGDLADGGGIHCERSSPNICNNVIVRNSVADDGGGISCVEGSNPLIKNNTIAYNRANPQGGGKP